MKTTPGNSLLPFLTCKSIPALPTPQGILCTKCPMRLARMFSSEILNYRVLREKDCGPRVLYSHQSLFSRYLRQQTEFLSLSFILVSSVCCDRIQTGWLVNNETIFSWCWRLEVQVEVQHSGVLRRSLSPVHTGCLLTLSSHTGRGRGRFLGSHL